MQEYGFSLIYILQNKDRIYDFVLIRENTGQRKRVFLHFLCSGWLTLSCIMLKMVKHTLIFFRCEHRRIFKVCITSLYERINID